MPEGHSAKVVIEGESSSAERAFSRSAQKAAEFDKSVTRVEASSKKANVALMNQAAAAEKTATATSKLNPALMKLNTVATAATGSALGLGRSVANVAQAFGPWGIAISIAGNLLLDLVDSQNAAADAAKNHREELRKGRAELFKQSKEDYYTKVVIPERQRAAEIATGMKGLRETEAFLEEEAANLRARGGKAYSEVISAQAKAKAEILRAQAQVASAGGDFDKESALRLEAVNELQQDKLRLIDEEQQAIVDAEKAAKKHHKTKVDQYAAERAAFQAMRLEAQLGATPGAGLQRNSGDFLDAQKAARAPGQIQRAGSDTRDLAAARERMTITQQQIELERAKQQQEVSFFGISQTNSALEFERIERERAANADYYETVANSTADTGEKLQAYEAIRQSNHDAQMQRIAVEQQAEAEKQEKIAKFIESGKQAATQTVMGILSITDARRGAISAAKAQGKTDAEAARAGKIATKEALASQLTSLRNLAIQKAIEQTAFGIGALASFNYPSAALHFAAAATWGVVAGGAAAGARGASDSAMQMQRADSQKAAGAGGKGGSGGGTSPRSGSYPGAGGPIPGSPGPSAPTAGGSGRGSSAPTRQVNITGPVYLMGAPTRELGRQLDEMLEQGAHDRRARRETG